MDVRNCALAETLANRSSAAPANLNHARNPVFIKPPETCCGGKRAIFAHKPFRQPFDLVGRVVLNSIGKCQAVFFRGGWVRLRVKRKSTTSHLAKRDLIA